jgi:ADP-ribose pyrophosphatase YjhB (NUDIX family)
MTRFPCARCGRPVSRDLRARPPRIACPRCRYLLYDYPRPCAGVVVRRGDEVLMLERGHRPRRGFLDLPGGFIEAGEDLETAARRELEEETGLTVGRLAWFGLYWDRYWLRGFGRFPTLNFYWTARWRSGEPKGADDAARAMWMPLARLRRERARLAWPHMVEVFRDLAAPRRRAGRDVTAPRR